MPIEIRELHIKINVDKEPSAPQPKDDSDIVAQCIEQMTMINNNKKER